MLFGELIPRVTALKEEDSEKNRRRPFRSAAWPRVRKGRLYRRCPLCIGSEREQYFQLFICLPSSQAVEEFLSHESDRRVKPIGRKRHSYNITVALNNARKGLDVFCNSVVRRWNGIACTKAGVCGRTRI